MKRIALCPNGSKDKGLEITRKTAELLTACGATVAVEKEYSIYDIKGVELAENTSGLLDNAELVITLGGDGTLLSIADQAAIRKIPILGINLGRIGFMAELETSKLELLKRLFTGDYQLEERMMLDVRVNGGESFCVLNDAVISCYGNRRMLDMTLFENEKKFAGFRADGLILSSPTGSTAYSLSAGGPVIDPRLRLMLAVPICAQSISSRPIIFAPDAALSVKDIVCQKDSVAEAVLDGRTYIKLKSDDTLTVTVSDKVTRLVQLCDRQFYSAVRKYFS